jgi:pimeloyl-ACP methyl ester carboxylesterase
MHFDKFELIFFIMGLILTIAGFALVYFMLPAREVDLYESGQTINVDGWDLHYISQGWGEPLLLIHGLGANLYTWNRTAALLAKKYRVIAVDLPGFGKSSKLTKAKYGLDDQVDRLEKFLRALNIEKCFLVGNSMGGNLALWLAKLHPDRFPYVVAIAPAAHSKLIPWGAKHLGFLSRPAAWIYRRPMATWVHKRTLGMPEKMNPRAVDQTLSVYANNPDAMKTFIRAFQAIADPRIGLENFETKALILYGEKDVLVPRWVIDALLPRVSDAKIEIHKTGGHQLHEDDPEWVAQKIISFLPPDFGR